ncbi:CHRD domain-containing protein [Maribacter sp. PR1]|uniref:CHRD domain-containing protein n=1 Tax=Maribacter cobaltidurans TaxID=1178778 RepID=A0ABU7IPM8_9FLAO|nr:MULTISPECIES: CHRD domain-containing protein [Maribacter]MDC6387518.1 CHRD domain-containing protein [Maribacter sp. PR1]MEE1974905.1 CHRD domain-containing protein [Maribacter cobaltidurans]
MKIRKTIKLILPIIMGAMLITSCSNDDDDIIPPIVDGGDSTTYQLSSVSNPDISGTAKVIDNEDNSITVELSLENTPNGGMHPAHIHFNTAAESGDIAITLGTVDGSTGMSTVTFSTLDEGTSISYEELLDFDGYINVHASADDLATLVAQGDIGQNELNGNTKVYELGSVAVDDISGTATFSERVNGEALATIVLNNTPADGMHPGHIHMNTAVESGDIAFTFNPVDGASGISKTNVSELDDGSAFTYNDVLTYDGYINIHLSADDLGTLVAQGDIGQNELSGESKTYELGSKDVDGIDGTATFEERVNGEALATIMLNNTPANGTHPGHIHMNTAAESGDIIFTFNPVDGATGICMTNVAALDDDTAFGYDQVLEVDGYINIHLSADNLGTIVAQGDIGQNELTGESKTYELGSVAVPTISGTATFDERVNGEALATIMLEGTPDGGMHPAHIHANTAAESGDILFTFNPVDGTSGMSMTNVAMLDDDSAFLYDDVLIMDGYINVHLSADDLGTIVAQGDIGENELTGTSKTYALATVDVPGISGDATFFERVSGDALAVIELTGTPAGGIHPAHIHANSAAETGPIIFSFNPVDGTTGISKTHVDVLDDETPFSYQGVLDVDGYINVHLSPDDLATIVSQGDIGINE